MGFTDWLKQKIRGFKRFILYDAATFVYAFLVTMYLWVVSEWTFLLLMGLANKYHELSEGQAAVMFALLHSLLLFGISLAYIKVEGLLKKIDYYLKRRGIIYTLHSTEWRELFVSLFSVTLSMYVLALIILIAYAMYPEKLKESIEVPLAVLYLILVSYLPILFLIQKVLKIVLYVRYAKNVEQLFILRDIQRNN